VLLAAPALAPHLHRIAAQPRLQQFIDRLGQVRSVNREMRPFVAEVPAAGLLMDKLPELVEPEELLRLDAAAPDARLDAQLREPAHGMWEEIDADAERLVSRRRFVHSAGNALAV